VGARIEHAPGTFSWVDLTTSDAAAAKDFYGALLGWDFEDNEIPGGGIYSMCRVEGENAAGISESADHPPHWNNYVTVASADESAARAKELGAALIEEPFDVMEAGRMALLVDPTGAALCLWEPRETIGAGRVNDLGCLTWNELHTPDPAAALEFYTGLFGWGTEAMETPPGAPSYTIVKVGERSNGGVMDAQEGEPPNWLPYFTVASRDDAADRAQELGAQELARLDLPQGSIAVLADPQGAPFAVFEGEVDD
jgi:predicted enzyme related to lactoylglutathione lyase